MKKSSIVYSVSALLVLMAGCSKHESSNSTSTAMTNSTSKSAYAAPVPNAGHITTVTVETTGSGLTRNDAVNDAVKNAILQEYGEKVNIDSIKYSAALHIADNLKTRNIEGQLSATAVQNVTNGLLTSLKIVKIKKPELFGLMGKSYHATIEASFPKFNGPKTHNLLKIVVGSIHTPGSSFTVGGETIPSSVVTHAIHQQLVTALSQTGRFVVLDRQDNSAIDRELSLIANGQTPSADYAKLGQVTSAQVIWSGTINNLGYYRHAQSLSISSRQIVSYSGGWSLSERLIDVTNRQIMAADTIQGAIPSIAPTTLGTNFSSSATLQNMENSIVHKVIASILMREYPITILQKTGNQVVLSQGGDSVEKGGLYRVVAMGKELRDPQTGQDLGRTQTPFGKVVIERVTPTLSYGRLVDVQADQESIAPGELQIGRMLASTYEANSTPQPVPASPANEEAAPAYQPMAQQPQEEASPERRKHNSDW
ncbi:CsgG/HfaB family protein [Acidithiobacillus albertensis]|uniref:CsgG/HfaB family protein n=1 Tax=Acidithiobacillus albertensis TaxID=119978 RepID=UPI00094AB4C0|nr:CsgG/HfaB family protein [Acidithiobacillus albertensis]